MLISYHQIQNGIWLHQRFKVIVKGTVLHQRGQLWPVSRERAPNTRRNVGAGCRTVGPNQHRKDLQVGLRAEVNWGKLGRQSQIPASRDFELS